MQQEKAEKIEDLEKHARKQMEETQASWKREERQRERRKLEAAGVSKAEMGEMLMDVNMKLAPLRDHETAGRLAVLDSKRAAKEENYVWVMMDSGAANHVCDPRRHFLGFRTHANVEGRKFVTATGEIIENEGQKNVKIQTANGLRCTIAFQCAKVDVPVLSTKMLCKADHDVTYTKDGGWIWDLRTGK